METLFEWLDPNRWLAWARDNPWLALAVGVPLAALILWRLVKGGLRRARLAFKLGRSTEAARLFGFSSETERTGEDDIMFSLALAGTERFQQALSVLDTVSARTDSVAGFMAPFVRAVLNTDRGETDRGSGAESNFRYV